jgi:hypothetical protein
MGASAGSEVELISSAQHNRQFKNPASKPVTILLS